MQVKVGGKNGTKIYNIPDDTIEHYMKSLDITKGEAINMWLCDRDIITNDEVEELTAKAKANGTSKVVVQSSVEKKKTERKPKENPLKETIISQIYRFLSEYHTISALKITNKTKTIDFMVDNKEFSLNLVEHRPKKK